MPSTTSSSVCSDLASSTVMTPSLPTFFMASARKRPISASPLAEMVATCAISSFDLILLEFCSISPISASIARSMPRLRSIGFTPAATAFAPSFTIAWASTVAVVVPSPTRSDVFDATSRTIWAPMFSNLSSSSISLATVTPSLVMRGAPNDFSMTTLRPLGPSVTLTALASVSTPRSMRSRASPENLTSLAAILDFSLASFELTVVLRREQSEPRRDESSGDHAHDVGFLHDEELVAIELDFGARPFAEQHAIAGFDPDRDQLAVLVAAAGTHGHHLALLRFLFGSVGNDDAAFGFVLGFDALDDHPVVERPEFGFRHDDPHLPRFGV